MTCDDLQPWEPAEATLSRAPVPVEVSVGGAQEGGAFGLPLCLGQNSSIRFLTDHGYLNLKVMHS